MTHIVVHNYVHRRGTRDGMFTGLGDDTSRRRIAAALGITFRRMGKSIDDLRAAMRVEGDIGVKYTPSAEAGYNLDPARANSAMRSFGGDSTKDAARDCSCGDCRDCRDRARDSEEVIRRIGPWTVYKNTRGYWEAKSPNATYVKTSEQEIMALVKAYPDGVVRMW